MNAKFYVFSVIALLSVNVLSATTASATTVAADEETTAAAVVTTAATTQKFLECVFKRIMRSKLRFQNSI